MRIKKEISWKKKSTIEYKIILDYQNSLITKLLIKLNMKRFRRMNKNKNKNVVYLHLLITLSW